MKSSGNQHAAELGLRLVKSLNGLLVTLPFLGCWYYARHVVLFPLHIGRQE